MSHLSQYSLVSDNYSKTFLCNSRLITVSLVPTVMMAARSISSRMTSSVATSPSYAAGLNRSQGSLSSLSSLSSPRAAYSFSSGYNNLYQGYSFSSYIASSSSGYSTISSTTPVVLRRKTSQLSRQEYKTRSRSVDASLYVSEQCGDSSVHGQPQERCESRAASVLPDLELPGDDDLERVRTKPVRNRQSHGVSQYDLERAATWAMIGSNKSITNDSKSEQEAIPVQMKNETSEIDYKKVNLLKEMLNATILLNA